MKFDASVAVVTGGASGLGLATAGALVTRGMQVVLLDLPSSQGQEAARQLGESARFSPADVTDEDAVGQAFDAALEMGPLRVIVNCAGTGGSRRLINRDGVIPQSNFMRIVGVNLGGTFNVIRLGVVRMLASDVVDGERGVIVNTTSVAAFDGQIGQAAYSASKGGIVGMTLPLARDLAASQIRVMSIAPGIFDTPLMQGMSEENKAALGKQVPHPGRFGRPAEFAGLVTHIISNPMLNGGVIRLDGAIRMAPR